MNTIFSDKKPEIPSEEQIEHLLREIQPEPGPQFHQRMENQPWKQGGHGPLWAGIKLRGLPATLILGLILVLIVSFASPALKVLANQIAQFFKSSSSEQITIQIPIEDLIDPEARFNINIAEAEQLAGFLAKTPASLPPGFSFNGAEYHPTRNAIVLDYQTKTGGILRISQRLIGVEYQNVSANAGIEIVEIGSVTGEYVVGGWKTTTVGVLDQTPDAEITLQAIWDPDASLQILRWQDNEMLYEIIFGGDCPEDEGCLDKFDLIDLAEDLH
jgi:hypothetical protein